MANIITKLAVAGAITVAAMASAVSTASAAIIGSANYFGTAGDSFDPGAPSGQPLELQLDGSTIFTIANPVAAIGTPISLASASPSAFNALVAILRDNVENDVTTLGFQGHSIPIEVTVTDFNYSSPFGTDDLQGSGTILDIVLTINAYKTSRVAIPGFGVFWVSDYDIDVDVDAVPVPAALLSGLSGLAMMGVVAIRRKRAAA